jgi:Domain of unknown function (DUF4189)
MQNITSHIHVWLRLSPGRMRVFPFAVLIVGIICLFGGSPNAMAADKFIAVYLHPDTLEWSSSQGNTLEAAKVNAREACGKGCKLAGWSKNACLALAITKSSGNCYGYSWGDTISEAMSKAMRYCKDRGCSCKVVYNECYK